MFTSPCRSCCKILSWKISANSIRIILAMLVKFYRMIFEKIIKALAALGSCHATSSWGVNENLRVSRFLEHRVFNTFSWNLHVIQWLVWSVRKKNYRLVNSTLICQTLITATFSQICQTICVLKMFQNQPSVKVNDVKIFPNNIFLVKINVKECIATLTCVFRCIEGRLCFS